MYLYDSIWNLLSSCLEILQASLGSSHYPKFWLGICILHIWLSWDYLVSKQTLMHDIPFTISNFYMNLYFGCNAKYNWLAKITVYVTKFLITGFTVIDGYKDYRDLQSAQCFSKIWILVNTCMSICFYCYTRCLGFEFVKEGRSPFDGDYLFGKCGSIPFYF